MDPDDGVLDEVIGNGEARCWYELEIESGVKAKVVAVSANGSKILTKNFIVIYERIQ